MPVEIHEAEVARSRSWVANRLVKLVIFTASLCFDATVSDASQTQTLGGGGGTPFAYSCPAGSYLVGLRARAGQVVDHVGAVCSAWDPSHAVAGPPRDMRAEFGGPGGVWTRFGCPGGSALAGWTIGDSYGDDPNVVGSIEEPLCRSLAKPAKAVGTENHLIGHHQGHTNFGSHFVSILHIECPAGQVGVGIFGGAGSYVDRLGLTCAVPAKTGAGR